MVVVLSAFANLGRTAGTLRLLKKDSTRNPFASERMQVFVYP